MSALTIDKRISVGDFQKEFNAVFPYLKIEFFKVGKTQIEGSNFKATSLLSSIDRIGVDTKIIEIDNSTTVAHLKSMLYDSLGIMSLIYRKSGSMWIETSLTEDWSLERQNHEAEQMSSPSI